METAADFVAPFVEFTSGMEHCQHNFKGAFVFFFMHVDRNASTVVDNGYGVVGVDCHFYVCGISCERFVNGVVNNFIDEVVQSFYADVSYIHGRALAHGFKSFEYLNVTRTVNFFFFCHR